MTGGNGKAPWDRAEAMRPELMERRYEMVNSSVRFHPIRVILTNANQLLNPLTLQGLGHSQCIQGSFPSHSRLSCVVIADMDSC